MSRQFLFLLAAAAAMAVAWAAPASAVSISILVPVQFGATLSNFGEPVPTSTATGSANFSFDSASRTVLVDESVSGIAGDMSGNHIHCCTDVPGMGSKGVALNFTGLPTGTSGQYTKAFTMAGADFNVLLAGAQAGKAFVNLPTPSTYAGGEVRGFLAPVPSSPPMP